MKVLQKEKLTSKKLGQAEAAQWTGETPRSTCKDCHRQTNDIGTDNFSPYLREYEFRFNHRTDD